MRKHVIQAIFACNLKHYIGKDNDLMYHIPEDLQWFKRMTKDSVMIMGRKTFESLPGILPGRKHVVITSNPPGRYIEGVEFWSDPFRALAWYNARYDKISVIGGANIINELIYFCNRAYVTTIHDDAVGDTQLGTHVLSYLNNYLEFRQAKHPMKGEHDGLDYRFHWFERL